MSKKLQQFCNRKLVIFGWSSLTMWHILLFFHYNCHFPGGPGSGGTRMSPFWILLELRMMEVMATTGAIRRAKLQSNHHHQQTNIQFFLQAGCPSCRPTNSVKALKGKCDTSYNGSKLHVHATLSTRLGQNWINLTIGTFHHSLLFNVTPHTLHLAILTGFAFCASLSLF